MARVLQLRQGTKEENDIFKGTLAELTYDSTNSDIRIHDGDHRGGYIIPSIIESQTQTTEKNYTWFRKYSDGWVEQGGRVETTDESYTVTLEVPIIGEAYYPKKITMIGDTTNVSYAIKNSSSTDFVIVLNGQQKGFYWEVKGRWK